MVEFLVACALFIGTHVAPRLFGLRQRLIAKLGRRNYMAGYSVASVTLLLWVLWSAQRAPYVELWPPSPARHAVPLLVMPLALALLGAGLLRTNRLSISLRVAGDAGAQPDGILSVTRHPVLWAFLLWAISHLIANGDLVSAFLFATLALFSAAGMIALDRRSRGKLGDDRWNGQARESPLIPLAKGLPARLRREDCTGIAIGLGLYAAMLAGLHQWLFGVVPFWP